jgi:hypothetical protein
MTDVPVKTAYDMPLVTEDADRRVAEGMAAMERGDEIDQEELFAKWRAKYV